MNKTEHLGDFKQGDFLAVLLQTMPSNALGWPNSAPRVSIFDAGGLVGRILMGADAQGLPPGHFRLSVFLGGNFPSEGWIHGHIEWTDGVIHRQAFTARILPGGDSSGSVIAMKYVRRPAGNFLVYQTDAGFVMKGSNPRT